MKETATEANTTTNSCDLCEGPKISSNNTVIALLRAQNKNSLLKCIKFHKSITLTLGKIKRKPLLNKLKPRNPIIWKYTLRPVKMHEPKATTIKTKMY